MDYLSAACRKLGLTAAQVLAHTLYATEIVLVVDRGIAGCPKYRIPLAELTAVPEPLTAAPEPDFVPAPPHLKNNRRRL